MSANHTYLDYCCFLITPIKKHLQLKQFKTATVKTGCRSV